MVGAETNAHLEYSQRWKRQSIGSSHDIPNSVAYVARFLRLSRGHGYAGHAYVW